jgi:arylformamidase
MAQLTDVTLPLSSHLPVYPGDPPFELRPTHRIATGDAYNVSHLSLGTHTGTHVDAPFHFEPGGATIDQLSLEALMGRALVVDVGERDRIDEAALVALGGRDVVRVLFKTRTSRRLRGADFPRDYVALTPEAAAHLIARRLQLVGIDSPSVEPFGSQDYAVHHALLRAGIVIVEGLDLSTIAAGEYDFTCLPLLVSGADGAPARAVLRTL